MGLCLDHAEQTQSQVMPIFFAQIPRNNSWCQTPMAWSTGATFKGNPKWEVLCFAVANRKGLDQDLDVNELRHV